MSKFLNLFKSKKGFSLAYAMVVCLFLALITGGITTVALLQHNETGSDLNTRQAYISAKSGLDSVKKHMTNGTVNVDDTGDIGTSKFFVMYTDESGVVQIHYENTEEAIKRFLNNNLPENATIIGGEGTYYQVTVKDKFGEDTEHYKADKIISVTSKNETGKYNDNVTINKGDLTFDVLTYTKYKVTEVETAPVGPPPTTPVITPPTAPPSDNDNLGGPLELVTEKETSTYNGTQPGSFLMVGQQYAYNDATVVKGSAEGNQAGLLQKEGREGAVDWDRNDPFYHVNVEVDEDDSGSYLSYFPVVYDKMAKVASTSDRCTIEAFNQGIYFCGDFRGYRNGNAYANTYSYEEYQWDVVKNGTIDKSTVNDMGSICYTTENPEWQFNMGCTLLCIENNFVHRMRENAVKHVRVYYSGTLASRKIYVQIPKGTWIYNCWENKTNSRPYQSYFYIPAGYYSFTGEFELTNINTWYNTSDIVSGKGGANTNRQNAIPKVKINSESELNIAKSYSLYDDIVKYESSGTIHSGGPENNNSSKVSIIDDDCGKYNDEVGGHYYSTNAGHSSFGYSSDYDNSHIFFAPRFSMGNNNPNNVNASAQPGTYHWYCGESFNFQWFRQFDFQVPENYNIEISAPQITLTIGPGLLLDKQVFNPETQQHEYALSGYSNKIVSKDSNNFFMLCGNKGKGGTTLRVMCDFVVEYSGKSYTIKQGKYKFTEPINLFSDVAASTFESSNISMPLASCIVAPGLSKQTFTLSSVFVNMFRGTFITNDITIPSVADIENAKGDTVEVSYEYIANAETGIMIPREYKNVEYKNIQKFTIERANGTFEEKYAFKLTMRDGFTIKKQLGDLYIDYITFEGIQENTNFNLFVYNDCIVYDPEHPPVLNLADCTKYLVDNEGLELSNYIIERGETVTEIIREYY